jgi:hypothetical protein
MPSDTRASSPHRATASIIASLQDRFGLERTLVVDLAEDETLDGPLTVGPAAQVQADGPRRWLRLAVTRPPPPN